MCYRDYSHLISVFKHDPYINFLNVIPYALQACTLLYVCPMFKARHYNCYYSFLSSPSISIVWTATINARVESSPPDNLNQSLQPICFILEARPTTRICKSQQNLSISSHIGINGICKTSFYINLIFHRESSNQPSSCINSVERILSL